MTNKGARQILELIYGKGCMFQRAKIAQIIEEIGGIKTYKTFVEGKRYKLRKIRRLQDTMTYHHLKHKSEGGRTTEDNGAVVSALAHQYMHSLPRDEEEVINDLIREYKTQFILRGGILVPTDTGLEIEQPIQLQLPLEFEQEGDYISIPLIDNSRDEYDRRYNRQKVKEETREIAENGMEDYLREDF